MIVSALDSPPADIVAFRTGQTRWDAAPADVPRLFDAEGLRLAAWQSAGLVDVVKDGPHRTVYRVRHPAGAFYLKHYRLADWKARLQNVVRPCRAMLEWTAARHVEASGIRTIETVAVGRRLDGGLVADSYLVTRSVDGTQTLHDFCEEHLAQLPAARQTRLRKDIARQLGEMVARLHAAGLLHRDLHAGNILLRLDDHDRVTLWLIDLHAVTARRHLGHRAARANIAMLGHFFARRATRADRLRFFQSYWNHRQSAAPPWHAGRSFTASARNLDAYCRQATERAYRQGDRKWQRSNRRLIIADDGGIRCRGVSELGRDRIEAFRRDPEQLFAVPGLRRPRTVRALTRTARVSVWIEGDRIGALAVARETTSWRERIRQIAGKSPLRLAWETGHALLRRGVRAPRPLLWISRTDGSVLREYLLIEESEGAIPLLELPEDEGACPRPMIARHGSLLARPGGPALASRR